MLTVMKPPLIKDYSPINSANTLPSPHHRALPSAAVQNYLCRAHKRNSSENRLFLGLWIQNSIPRNGKENNTFWKTSMHIKFSMTARPAGIMGLGKDWFQD